MAAAHFLLPASNFCSDVHQWLVRFPATVLFRYSLVLLASQNLHVSSTFFFSFLSFFFLNAPGGFLPAASWLPGWRDKADILKALPQAIPLLPMVQELEPKLHRELEARRDSEKSGLSPGATGTEACHCLFSPTRPLHICVLFGGSFS